MTVWLIVLLALSLTGIAVLAVLWQRARREAGRLRAAQRAVQIEHNQNQVEAAVSAERTRILREMHDVIAHSLAIMVAQADGGSYATDPSATKRALETIADTGRLALADTRRILGMLRTGEEQEPQLSPAPPRPASPSSSRTPAMPGWRPASSSWASPGSCPRRSGWPCTGSVRRPSPTC